MWHFCADAGHQHTWRRRADRSRFRPYLPGEPALQVSLWKMPRASTNSLTSGSLPYSRCMSVHCSQIRNSNWHITDLMLRLYMCLIFHSSVGAVRYERIAMTKAPQAVHAFELHTCHACAAPLGSVMLLLHGGVHSAGVVSQVTPLVLYALEQGHAGACEQSQPAPARCPAAALPLCACAQPLDAVLAHFAEELHHLLAYATVQGCQLPGHCAHGCAHWQLLLAAWPPKVRPSLTSGESCLASPVKMELQH